MRKNSEDMWMRVERVMGFSYRRRKEIVSVVCVGAWLLESWVSWRNPNLNLILKSCTLFGFDWINLHTTVGTIWEFRIYFRAENMVIFIRYRSKLLREDFWRKIIMNNDGKKKGREETAWRLLNKNIWTLEFGYMRN